MDLPRHSLLHIFEDCSIWPGKVEAKTSVASGRRQTKVYKKEAL